MIGVTSRSALDLHDRQKGTSVEKVTGLGGVFWRADNPEQLAEWYRNRLGVEGAPSDDSNAPWHQEAGFTVFAPFKRDTTYFANEQQQVMFNFRVRDLDVMVAQLRAVGEQVTTDPESYPHGRFARLYDPVLRSRVR